MSVIIISGIPIFAGPTANPATVISIQAPNIPGGGAIGIGDVFGLQAALDQKLNDAIGTVAPFTVDVTITGAELNFLAGVTSLIQTQLDSKVNVAGDLMVGNLAFGASAQLEADAGTSGLPSIVCFGDLDTGFFWPAPDTLGISVGTLDAFRVLPTGLLQSQIANYETLVVADDDIPNKKYVDDEIFLAVGGPFLPLAGGNMVGDICLDDNRLKLDLDSDSFWESIVDDVVDLWVGGVKVLTVDAGQLNNRGRVVANVLDPSGLQDAATKNYVDTEIVALSLGGTGPFLQLAGGTMTGALDMGGLVINAVLDPTLAQDAATKNYVDTEIVALNLGTTFLALAGGTMSGAIDMGTNLINNVVDPVGVQDAATKNYVDTEIASEALLLTGGTLSGVLGMGSNLIQGVSDPVEGPDAANKNYVDTEITALGIGGATGPFLELAGGTMAGAIAMGAFGITGVLNPVLAQDAATKNYIDTEIVALSLGGTGPFLQLAGGTMAGALDMGTNALRGVPDPVEGPDAANKNYVDTEITALNLTDTFVDVAGDTMTGDLIMNVGVQHSADAGLVSAPSYAFTGSLDGGMFHDGTNLRFALDGALGLTISTTTLDAHGRRLEGLVDPTADDEAVTKGFLDAQSMVKLLGSVGSVDLLSTGITTVYTVPAGKMHIITQILVRTTSYTPGVTPSNPQASVGLTGSFNQIIDNNTVLDWGGTAGAGDQAVYLQPKDGADTPNAGSLVRFQVDTAGAGTFSALEATVYVLGIEL